MSDPTAIRRRLTNYRQRLLEIDPLQANWVEFEGWIAGFRVFVRRYFPSELPDFDEIARTPSWASSVPEDAGLLLSRIDPITMMRDQSKREQDAATNNSLVTTTRSRLKGFLDTLIAECDHMPTKVGEKTGEAPTPVPTPVPYLPFRPYNRPTVKFTTPTFG
jgi:hypothetical protein